jgi:cytochrome c biogenesis protein CcmG, thiol:disulfide interchange protein DsbE
MALVACTKVDAGPGINHALSHKPVVDFRRATLAGGILDTVELRDKTIVIKFFADYCIPCRRTLPEAERVHRANPNVQFIGISEDESADIAQRLVQRYALTFPVVLDQENVLSARYRANEMPIAFVIRRGEIVWVGGPDQTEAQLAAAVSS